MPGSTTMGGSRRSRAVLAVSVLAGAALAAAIDGTMASGHDAYSKRGAWFPTITYTNVDGAPPSRDNPNPVDPLDFFSGAIIGRGKKPLSENICRQSRTVSVRAVGSPLAAVIGQTTTFSADGSWLLFAEDVPPGQYEAVLHKKKKVIKIPPKKRSPGHRHSYVCLLRVSTPILAGP